MSPEIPIKSIGAELVQAAEEWERSPGELLTELFPYVFEASKRMSTRAISRWLEETHGIKISQPTVSRALRNPERYWQPFAELMEPHARVVERAVPAALSSFMADERVFDWALEQSLEVAGQNREEMEKEREEVGKAAQYLRDHWFCLSSTTRSYMHQFFEDVETEGQETVKNGEEMK